MKKLIVITLALIGTLALWGRNALAGPTNLVLRGVWAGAPGGEALRVQVVGNLAYLADGAGGLQIIEVSDPSRPVLRGTYSGGARTVDLHVIGTRAYLANGTNCLEIIDVSEPSQPTRVGGFKPAGYYRSAGSIFVRDNLAYLADGTLFILDASSPSAVVQLCNLDNVGHAADLAVAGSFAYLAGEHFVSIYNVANSRAPFWLGYFDCMFAGELCVLGETVFVAEQLVGLRVLDVSNPANPTQVGQYPNHEAMQAWGLAVAEDYAYVALGGAGITVLDVRNRTQPVSVSGYNTAGFANSVCVVGNFVFVADGPNGLVILEAEPAGERPRLAIACTETNAWLSWPASALGFVLVTNSDLRTSNWYPVLDPPELDGEMFRVSRPALGQEYFRLRRQ